MKKFIDKEKGRIVTVLSVDEAKKILEMYIEFSLGKREVKEGRLNLVNYLGDFITYANEKDIAKFYDILVKEKENFGLSKNDLKAYESMMSFFEMYNNIEKGQFDLTSVSDYITSALTRKQVIDSKVESGQELNFEEKLNNIFFNKDFDLSILAKKACGKWEELLKQKIEQNEDGVDVSLKEEIAYQDLLALCDNKNLVISNNKEYEKEEKNEPENTENVKKENDQKVDEVKPEIKKDNENDIQINVEDKKDEESKENNTEEVIGPQILNMVKDDKKEEKNDKINSNKQEEEELIIGSSSIREATQDVSLRDAANTFNEAIDDISKKNNDNNSNSSDAFDTIRGTLRDE